MALKVIRKTNDLPDVEKALVALQRKQTPASAGKAVDEVIYALVDAEGDTNDELQAVEVKIKALMKEGELGNLLKKQAKLQKRRSDIDLAREKIRAKMEEILLNASTLDDEKFETDDFAEIDLTSDTGLKVEFRLVRSGSGRLVVDVPDSQLAGKVSSKLLTQKPDNKLFRAAIAEGKLEGIAHIEKPATLRMNIKRV